MTRLVPLLLLPWLLGAGTDLRLVVHRSPALGQGPEVAAFLAAQLARANAQLGAARIHLQSEERAAGTIPLEVRTRQERHALAEHAPTDGDLHLFLVRRLANVDGQGDICGVHWRYRGSRRAWQGRRYLILSLPDALADTMAHELGHYFGLAHQRSAGNLMTSPGRAETSALAPWQVRRIQAALRAALRARTLTAVRAAQRPAVRK
jgi:hypothetical protein